MMKTTLLIAVLVNVGMVWASLAAHAKHRHIRHHTLTLQPATSLVTGVRTTQPLATTQSGAYGASGNPIGSVTAPSVGSYSWSSVGVTNGVPTWSNTTK